MSDRSSDSPVIVRRRLRGPGIEFNRIGFVIGIMLLVMTLFMLPPAVTDVIANNPDWRVFVGSAFISGFFGVMLIMVTRDSWNQDVTLKEGFLLTVCAWLVLSTTAAIPLLFFEGGFENKVGLTAVDAWFEAVSGLTTTGSTVIVNLDAMPPGILLWRSIIQWIGGVGIVLMALIMLPFLRVGGMQLFQTESSDRSDKFVPRAGELMSLIALTYLVLTALCGTAYRVAGMSTFDALNHAMTTVATAGFSTHDASFGHFENPALAWIAMAFMLASSLPLVLYVKAVRTGSLDLLRDQQVRGFVRTVLIAVIALTVWYMLRWEVSVAEAARIVGFNVVSIVSTTGYSAGDYTAWGPGAAGVFFLLMFIGGCTGSTSGGMKIFRLQVMAASARNYIRKLMSPNRILVMTFNGKKITDDISMSVLAYVTVVVVSVMIFTVMLTFMGLDFLTSISGATSALMNIGPALGPTIGPAGTFSPLPDGAKIILAIGMLLGRLEFFTLLVVFNREFWR